MLLPPASVLLLRAQDLPGFGSGLCSKAYLLFCLRGEQVKVSLELERLARPSPLAHLCQACLGLSETSIREVLMGTCHRL